MNLLSSPLITKDSLVFVSRDITVHSFLRHPGNRAFHTLVESHKEYYRRSHPSKQANNAVAKSILQQMRSGGARFMKHNDEKGTWREIPNKEENAVLKVIRKALRKRKVHVEMLIQYYCNGRRRGVSCARGTSPGSIY